MTKNTAEKLFYIENLRILLASLIVILHVAVTYGAAGSWYYYEHTGDILSNVSLTLLTAVIQSFALGFFFMISGYFTPDSLERKGFKNFFKGRLTHLGIPFLFYYIVINPALLYFKGSDLPFYRLFGSGPLWFVKLLFIFNIIYAVSRYILNSGTKEPGQRKNFSDRKILFFALFLSLVNFIVRIWSPSGVWFDDIQFAYLPGYISFFVMGIVSYRNQWFERFPDALGKRWLKISGFTALSAPVIMLMGGGDKDITPFMGGMYWQAFFYSAWDAFVGIGVVSGLFVLFRGRFNSQGSLAKKLSESAYAVYIIHAPVIVFLSYSVRNIILFPILKFVIVSIIGVSLCFFISHYLIRNIPFMKRVL